MVRRALVERALLVAFLGSFASDARAAHKEDPVGTLPPSPRTVQPVRPGPVLTLRRDVYFEATSPRAQLQVWYPDGWRTVCVQPNCLATNIYVGAEYRVAGPGLVESRSFSVYPNPGTLYLRANVGSRTSRTAGAVLMGVGGAAILVGAGWVALSVISVSSPEEKDRAGTPGAFVVGGGALLLTAGLVVFLMSHTGLDFGNWAAPARPSALRRGLELFGKGVEF